MTQSYWPFDGTDTSETQYSQLFRRLQMSGVWGAPNDNALKPYADSSGLNVKLPAGGYAFVRGFMYHTDDIVTIPVDVGGILARYDLLVLRLDPTANSILPVVIKGDEGAGVAPAPVQTDAGSYDLVLGDILVDASAPSIAAGKVSDQRSFAAHQWGLWVTAKRPSSPRQGQPGYNTTLAKPEYWDGNDWVLFTPSSIAAATLTGTIDSARLPIVPVTKGGTGASDAGGARTNLGITPGNIGAAASSHTHLAADITDAIPVAGGGTGATTAGGARTNLGAAAAAHTHPITEVGFIKSVTTPTVVAGAVWLKPI